MIPGFQAYFMSAGSGGVLLRRRGHALLYETLQIIITDD